jgi:hypothetical protein
MIQAFLPLIGSVLDRVIPDEKAKSEAKLKMLEMAQNGEMEEAERSFQLAMGQIEINKTEATSNDPFKSRWRPAVGWVCVFGFAYQMLARPLLPWLLTVLGVDGVPELPAIDSESLIALMSAMLGLGVYRTTEKLKGRA